MAGEPGSELGAVEWLTGKESLRLPRDNTAVEVLPGTDHPKTLMPVHQHSLVEAGAYLIENVVTENLVSDGF